jgi:hypothetical protein
MCFESNYSSSLSLRFLQPVMVKYASGIWIVLKAAYLAYLRYHPSPLRQIKIQTSELLFLGDRMDPALQSQEKIKVRWCTSGHRNTTTYHKLNKKSNITDVQLIGRGTWQPTAVLRDGHDEVGDSW